MKKKKITLKNNLTHIKAITLAYKIICKILVVLMKIKFKSIKFRIKTI